MFKLQDIFVTELQSVRFAISGTDENLTSIQVRRADSGNYIVVVLTDTEVTLKGEFYSMSIANEYADFTRDRLELANAN